MSPFQFIILYAINVQISFITKKQPGKQQVHTSSLDGSTDKSYFDIVVRAKS